MSAAARDEGLLRWSSAGSALVPGHSGDVAVVICNAATALVAVIDGLGHGPEACAAATEAAALVQQYAQSSLLDIIRGCHAGLMKSRGVVMSLARVDARDNSLSWAGVGNVEALLLRCDLLSKSKREALVTRGGVVGFQMPPLKASVVAIEPGDTLVMATDGLRSAFCEVDVRGREPDELASALLTEYERGTDDALVLVARYCGAAQ